MHGGTSGWQYWGRKIRGNGGALCTKSADSTISPEFTAGWGRSWTYKLFFTCLVPKEKYPTHTLIWWERTVHTPDACGASSKLQSVRFYTTLDQAPLIRAKASHKHFNAWLTLCLSDRPPATHKNWMDWVIGEIHTSMRLNLQNCCWACPSSLVLPSGSNNPFNFLSQITTSLALEKKCCQPPLSQQNSTNTLVTEPTRWLQDRCNDPSWVPGRLHPGRGLISNLHPGPLVPICHDPFLGPPPKSNTRLHKDAHSRWWLAPSWSLQQALPHSTLVACLSYLELPWSSPRYWLSFLTGSLKTLPWWTLVIQRFVFSYTWLHSFENESIQNKFSFIVLLLVEENMYYTRLVEMEKHIYSSLWEVAF